MKMITLLTVSILAFVTLSASAQSRNKKQPAQKTNHVHEAKFTHRIVIQISSGDTLEHKGLMTNLRNLKEGWGDSVELEVVVHGPGIELVTNAKTTQNETIQKMIANGVRFVVCRNTMKMRNVTEDQIIPNVGFVPMGVGEIVLKQEQGWSYLKAGF